MVKVLEAVPNFSEGRDVALVRALVDVISRAGVEVLDWSADPDHHRSVVTFIGDPQSVEDASLDAARLALERILSRRNRR
jgi:glutamate formiminotransferase